MELASSHLAFVLQTKRRLHFSTNSEQQTSNFTHQSEIFKIDLKSHSTDFVKLIISKQDNGY